MMVRGTKVTRDTSLVMNGARKNTVPTRKKDRAFTELKRSVRRKKGRNIFSFLKPSSTKRSMNRVKSVCQSRERNLSPVGGEIIRETRAARKDTVKTICFLQKFLIFSIFNFPYSAFSFLNALV